MAHNYIALRAQRNIRLLHKPEAKNRPVFCMKIVLKITLHTLVVGIIKDAIGRWPFPCLFCNWKITAVDDADAVAIGNVSSSCHLATLVSRCGR